MLYTDIAKIPLSRFIDIYCGDRDALIINGKHSEKELSETANSLIQKYIEIAGGKSINTELRAKDERLILESKVSCMEACLNIIKLGDYDSVANILNNFGYKLACNTDSDKMRIHSRVQSILQQGKMRIAQLDSKKKDVKPIDKPTREQFASEMAIVMSRFKPFNENEISAAVYANWVKIMCDEIRNKPI